jgi:hypothetical protein
MAMAAKTTAPQFTPTGALRPSKNELMRQWRNRSVVTRLLPSLFWVLGGLALVIEGAVLSGGIGLLAGLDSFLPAGVCGVLQSMKTVASPAAASPEWAEVGNHLPWLQDLSPRHLAILASLTAAGLLGLSLLARRSWPTAASGLYGLNWLALLTCLFSAGFEVVVQVRFIGPSPLSSLNEWLGWVGFLTVALGAALELAFRRRWTALATAVAAALVLLASDYWTSGAFRMPASGVIVSRLGMLVPGILLVAGYAAFALAWAHGMLGLGHTLFAPSRLEPRQTLAVSDLCCLRLGVTLLAAAMLLDSSWGGQTAINLWSWQPREVWGISPLVLGLLLLMAYGQKWFHDFGVMLWTVVGLTLLALGWTLAQPLTGVACWGAWLGLLSIGLATHATHRHLFSRSSAWKSPAGNLSRESYRNLARSPV